MTGPALTYDNLVALVWQIENEGGRIFAPINLERAASVRVREERRGVTPAGMPWMSVS